MTNYFGTDGIRGKANEAPLDPETLTRIGQALGTYWGQRGSSGEILIGHDGRLSHDLLESALTSGLVSVGLNPQMLGLCTTPSLSYLCREKPVLGGIMVSASHNPFDDNGIKPLRDTGEKFTVSQEESVSEILERGSFSRSRGRDVGEFRFRDEWILDYVDAIHRRAETFPGHVVVDCANGAGSSIVPTVLSKFVGELTVLNNEPNGININKNSGSLHPEVVSEAVQQKNADIGFSLDGDGDRVMAVDDSGEVADGDIVMNLLARTFAEQNELPDSGIVMTTMSNLGLRLALQEKGLEYEIVGVGDRVVYSELKDRGWRLGGEQSGHIIDRNWLPTGDGLNTLISILNAIVTSERPLSSWAGEIEKFPQVLHNIEVDRKPSLEQLTKTRTRIEEIESELGDDGRVLVRYSGTEPVARIMLEGRDEEKLNRLATTIGEIMQQEIETHEGADND